MCCHDEEKTELRMPDAVKERVDQELLYVTEDGLHIGPTLLGCWYADFIATGCHWN